MPVTAHNSHNYIGSEMSPTKFAEPRTRQTSWSPKSQFEDQGPDNPTFICKIAAVGHAISCPHQAELGYAGDLARGEAGKPI
jgi:hypothetical protein